MGFLEGPICRDHVPVAWNRLERLCIVGRKVLLKSTLGPPPEGRVMKNFAIGLLSAAALATTILLVRQQKEVEPRDTRLIHAGETQPTTISLERIRELGL